MDEKTYVYRNHIFTINKYVRIFAPIFCVLGFVFMFLWEYTAVGIFVIFISVFDFMMYRNFVSTKFILREEEFEYRVNHVSQIIRYEDIKKLDSRSIRYTGGWLQIVPKEGRPIRLTVVIHDVGEMIVTLKEKLDALNLSDRYDEVKLAQFYKTAVYSERSWIRGGKIVAWLFLGMFIEFAMVIAQVAVMENLDALLIFIACLVVQLVPYLYVEFGIYAKEMKNVILNESWDLPEMNPALDKKRMHQVLLWFCAIGIIAMGLPWLFL